MMSVTDDQNNAILSQFEDDTTIEQKQIDRKKMEFQSKERLCDKPVPRKRTVK